jgi:multiple sugar transport system permease protein
VDTKRNQNIGYLFLLPAAILIALFILYPFATAIYKSFFAQRLGIGELTFCGFKNYISIFRDVDFRAAAKKSLVWAGMSMALQMTLPLLIALYINRDFRGKIFILAILLIPWIAPPAGLSMLVKWLLEPQLGIVNTALRKLGIVRQSVNFLGDPRLALPTLIVVTTWQFAPFGVLLLTATLSTIPPSMYDAMKADGANRWQIFARLQLPMIGSMIGFLFFVGFVWTFNKFDIIKIITGGGPAGSTQTLPLLIYTKAFESFNTSQAAAMSSIIGVGLGLLGFLFFKYMYQHRDW